MVLYIHPGIHDEATAGERPIEGGVTAVAPQAPIGSHLGHFPGEVGRAPNTHAVDGTRTYYFGNVLIEDYNRNEIKMSSLFGESAS